MKGVSNQLVKLASGCAGKPEHGLIVTDQGGILLLVWSRHDFDAAVGTDDDFLFGECDGFARLFSRVRLLLAWKVQCGDGRF